MSKAKRTRLCNLRLSVHDRFRHIAQVMIPEPDSVFDDRAIMYEGEIYANGCIDGNLVSYTYERLTVVQSQPVTEADLVQFERGLAKRKAYNKRRGLDDTCEMEDCGEMEGPW